jgi:hypothetical protein
MKKNRTITRPLTNQTIVQEGVYNGCEIESADIMEMDSQFHETGKRDVLNLKVRIPLPNGDSATLFYAPNLAWGAKSRMVKLLQDLEALPDPGEDLDLDSLVGMKVTVFVENVEKDDKTYSNIVKMKKEKGTAVRPPVPARKVTQSDLNEMEDLFKDEYECEEVESMEKIG